MPITAAKEKLGVVHRHGQFTGTARKSAPNNSSQ
jgi:hypothetical protein